VHWHLATLLQLEAIPVLMLALIAKRRSLAPWLTGLFLVAQILGVLPLISGHTAHVAALELTLPSGDDSSAPSPHSGHHRGDADGLAQHHELQDLNGAFPHLITGVEVALVVVAITGNPADALTENEPALLERPPKPFLSI